MKQKIKANIANILTISRLLMLPVMIWLLYIPNAWAAWLCMFLYIIAATTDYMDGKLARKYNQITPFGTFFDPISDKIFVAALLVVLVAVGKIPPLWEILVVIIFAREFLVSGLREYLAPKGVQMPVTFLAKWKTATQMLSLGFLIMAGIAPYALEFGLLLLSLATLLTVVTGGMYMAAGMTYLRLPKDHFDKTSEPE